MTKRTTMDRSVPESKPAPKVYREHVDILREMRAPEKIIEMAERVAAENGVPKSRE